MDRSIDRSTEFFKYEERYLYLCLARDQSSWLETISTSGAMSDKMAAMTLQVQEDPIKHMQLIGMLCLTCLND